MRIGLNVAIGPDGPQTHEEIVHEVRAAATAGIDSVWWSQLPAFEGIAPWDALTSIAATGAQVPGIELGTSVVVSFTRHPLALAGDALTTQAIVGNRLTLGIGTSHAPVVEGVFGLPFERPARHLREYLEILGPALRGEAVDGHGQIHSGVGTVQIPGAEAPSLIVAALGPQMLQLAGELTDGTITTWAGPRAVADHVVPRIEAAAAAAGRARPRIIVNLPMSITADPTGARAYVAERFGLAGQLPSYRRMLDLDGYDEPADAVLAGTEEDVAAAIERLVDAGTTELVPSVFGPRPDRDRTLAFLSDLAHRRPDAVPSAPLAS